jgi:hypothetical protein
MNRSDPYVRPEVTDYGDLWQITATADPVLGATGVQDLSFSSPTSSPGSSPGSVVGGTSPADTGGVAGTGATGGTGGAGANGSPGASGGVAGTSLGSGGGGGGGGGGNGGSLPFTGLAAGGVAALGTGLAFLGNALRKATGRRRAP